MAGRIFGSASVGNATAPAIAEVSALRQVVVDAHYAYVGGYKMQTKRSHVDYAHRIMAKAQHPCSFVRTVAAFDRLIDHHHIDIVHAHLIYDHVLGAVHAGRQGPTPRNAITPPWVLGRARDRGRGDARLGMVHPRVSV